MAGTFHARFKEAFRELLARDAAMNQSRFAADVGMSRSNVTHWLSGRGKKPSAEKASPAASRLGVGLDWLLKGEGPKYAAMEQSPGHHAERPAPTLELTVEIDGVELTKQAIKVAKAFMDLPRNMRDEYQQKIEAESLRHSSRVPDENKGLVDYSKASIPPPPKKRTPHTQ